MTHEKGRVLPGWPYWLVAGLGLLWNAFGCLDFTLTVTRNPAWLAPLPPAVIDWLDAAPTWTLPPWALGVWGGLAGAVLLLVRSRGAVWAFAVSLLGLAVSQAWQWSTPMPGSTDTASLVLTAAIWIIALGLLWFAWTKRRDGTLG